MNKHIPSHINEGTEGQCLKDQSEQKCEMKLINFISDANPIQKREKLKPHSIFPLLQLPKFKFSHQNHQPTVINENVNLQPEIFNLQSQSLKQIFRQPVFIYNKRGSMKNNSDFGCMKVSSSESKEYAFGKNPQTITQYLQINKKVSKQKEFIPFPQRISEVEKEEINSVQLQMERFYSVDLDKNQQIYFQSRFQSGNLCFACKGEDQSYYLICSRDMNTSKCTQWFFFKTINKLPGPVTFHILNFTKQYSVFQNGMKICYASKLNGYKWARGCSQIKYRRTNIPTKNKAVEKFYYALSFSYTYACPQDNVYFAYCYPYTFSMLQQLLFHKIEASPYAKRRKIGESLGNNSIDLITITNFKNKNKKKTIFITSRVHPGETPSSFVCEGMIKYLIGNSEEAQSLRDKFIFKFIPMLNPDGVINGSYRCSLSGYDLNRVWHLADKNAHPEIYEVRKTIFQLSQNEEILLFLDMHAHSKKKGIFAYGCQNKNQPYLCRHIPFLLQKNVPDFNYYQCNFVMKTGRQGTSRLYMYRNLEIDYSYTIEHSFCGPSKQKKHFTVRDYNKTGVEYLLTFYKYFCSQHKSYEASEMQVFKELYNNKELIKVGDAEELSSSDEELDKEKAPFGYENRREKLGNRRGQRVSDRKISQSNKTSTNYYRKTSNSIKVLKQNNFLTRRKEIPLFLQTLRNIPVIEPELTTQKTQEKEVQKNFNLNEIIFQRKCFSSLNKQYSTQQKVRFTRSQRTQSFRYSDINPNDALTNLFLPSLASSSYQKYNRKGPYPKDFTQSNLNLLETAKQLKEEIKSVQKKKPNWKQHAKSYL